MILALACATPAVAQQGLALAYAPGTDRAALEIGPDRASAARAARQACGAGCRVLAIVPSSHCLALARAPGRHGWAALEFGREAEARERAIGYCRGTDPSRACSVLASRCLPPQPAPPAYGQPQLRPIADPAGTIVIIYSHGSYPPTVPDPCEMDRINAPFGVPAVIHALDGTVIAGRRVVVDGFCTPTRVGVFDPTTGRIGKLAARARDIAARAAAYVAAGVPARQVIVAGHSAGGWASLVALRDHSEAIAAAIAFAPAAFDRAATRLPEVEAIRRQRYAEMTAAARLPALIFGFDGDAFETAGDLSALAAIVGVQFVQISEPGSGGIDIVDGVDTPGCVLEPHIRVRDLCFSETQGARLRDFIAAMVAQ